MILADHYFKNILRKINSEGVWCENPRTRWADGKKAYYKSIKQAVFNYNIESGELPLGTLRKTALKGAFYDIEAIYMKQTNLINEMHPSIKGWWRPFVVEKFTKYSFLGCTVQYSSPFGKN